MLKTKSTVFIAIYVLLLLTCISETYAQNNQFRTILVGGDDSYPPYEYFDEQGYPAGFNIDIIQAVAKVMGLRLDLKLGPWNKVRQDLEHGRLDALSGMYYSDDRDRLVDFSTPHILVSYAIFVRKNSNIKGIEDLPNQHIIVQKGDMGDDYITKTKMGSQIVRVENPAIALRLLAKGRQDCAILPRLLGLHLIDQFTLENIETAGSPFLNRKYCFAVRQGDENLLGLLNEGLVIIRKTGIYDQIYSKWFGAYEKRNARAEIINYLIWVLVPVVALLGLVFGWAWSLRRTVASKTRKLVDELAERKRAEEALKESESRHRTLVDTIPDLIWLKDQNGVYISCNPTFERFFGAKESEIVGKTDYDFVDKDLADFFREHDQKAMQAGRPSINEEWLTFADNGYYGLFETIKIPMRDTNGNLMGVLGIARDITERHKSEKEKISLKSQLSQIQKMESLGTLAGGIAHDFNNILASIIGYTELSLDIVDKGTNIHANLQEVLVAGNRARDLVKQILTMSRNDPKEIMTIQIAPLVKEALKMLRSTIPTSIEVKDKISSDPLIIEVDPSQLHQVVVNLSTNAKQAMADGYGVLEVCVDAVDFDADIQKKYQDIKPGKYARITVSDTGPGIPEEHIDKIFEPYFTTKEKGTGTGLGLSVVHGIVKGSNGHITVFSEPGKGTTFNVYLPLVKKVAAEWQIHNDDQLPTGTEHILLVDDELSIGNMQQQLLERLGYMVTTRTSSLEALETFRASPDKFEIVITDVTMPYMTGDRLAQEIKSIRSDVPVILCTGFSEKINGHCENLDIDGFLMKPVDQTKMAKTVRQVLDKHKGNTQNGSI